MRALGWALNIVAGLILLYVAYTFLRIDNIFEDTIFSGIARRVALRESAIFIFSAVILVVFGILAINADPNDERAPASFKGELSLSNDAYKIFLASKFDIKRNEVFSAFILDEKMYQTLDEALNAAHELYLSSLARVAEEPRIRNSMARRHQ